MNTPIQDEKIIGISKAKYLKVTYTLLLISSAFGVLVSLLNLVGISLSLLTLASFLGLAGLILALLGLFVFNDKFPPVTRTHFKYIGFLFIASIVIGLILSLALGNTGALWDLIGIVLNAAVLVFMYTGFKLAERGVEATKDNVINEVKSLKSGLKNS